MAGVVELRTGRPFAGGAGPPPPQEDKEPPLVRVEGVTKLFKIYKRPRDRLADWLGVGKGPRHTPFWALKGVDLTVRRGECVGIVGRNGSGKSTLLKIVTGTMAATGGTSTTRGRVLALLELNAGFNRELTGRENIAQSARLLGFEPAYVRERRKDIVEFAALGPFIDRPVRLYSSGMLVRLAFSLFVFLEPDVLIVDEALSVGDLAFQRKCFRRMEQMIRNEDRAVVLVTHDMNAINRFCRRAIWLENGEVRMAGAPIEVTAAYQKAMLTGTLGAQPVRDGRAAEVVPLAVNAAGVPAAGRLRRSEAAVAYPSRGVGLAGVWLEDAEGGVVAAPAVDTAFSVCSAFRFERPCDRPIFGTRLVTKKGEIVYGTNTAMHGVETRAYAPGDVEVVRWPLRPGLGVGDYFVSCGCSAHDNPHDFLMREVDAFSFAVRGPGANEGLTSLVERPVLGARP